MEASGATEAACRAELARCGRDLRLAMLCLLSGLEPKAAAKALAAGGSAPAALAAARTARAPAAAGEVGLPGPARRAVAMQDFEMALVFCSVLTFAAD